MKWGTKLLSRAGLFFAISGIWFLSGTASVNGNSTTVQQSPAVGGVLLVVGIALFIGGNFVIGPDTA